MDEIIGSVGIQIEADASDLQGQFDAAVNQAEDASERIAQAFESLIGIGEALAITEGLKEFGEEALNVYGTIQSVTIGLTQLTKSASDANEIISEVKELANTEPFAFPEIAPTVQKMVALGVSAEQIPAVMQAAANAAAATGNSFDAVANSIDRMSLSGTVNARALVQLGISTEDLGRAMGVTADQVKTAFAALDQSARIDILTAALEKFSGSAEAAAQGIAGQWQIFQNKFEEVMEVVGNAITPAVHDLLQFGDSALHVAQEAIDAFNELPEPVREIAGLFAVAAAAIAPLAAGIGILGQGLIGIQAVVGSVSTLMAALGISTGEAATATAAEGSAATTAATEIAALATAEGAAGVAAGEMAIAEAEAATSTAASGEAANTAVFGFAAMDTAAKGAGVALAGLLIYDLASWADKNVPAIHSMADEVYGLGQKIYDLSIGIPGASEALTLWVTGALKPGAAAADQLSQSTFLLSQKLGELGIVIPRGTMSMQQWSAALQAAAANYKTTGDAVAGLGGGLDALVAKQEKLNATEQQAAADLLIAKQAYADGAIGLDVLNAAQDAYTKAVTAAQSKTSDFKDTLAGITDTYNKQQQSIATLQQTVMQLMAAQDGSVAMAEKLAVAEQKLDAQYAALAKDAKGYGNVIQGTGENFVYMGDQAEALVQKQRDLTLSVQQSAAVVKVLNDQADSSPEHTRAVIQALTDWQTAIKNTGGDLNQLQTIVINGVLFSGKLPDIIKQAQDHLKQFGGTVVSVADEFNVLGIYGGIISDTMKSNITVIKGSDDAMKSYNGTIISGHQAVTQISGDVTKASNYFQQFTGSVDSTGAAIGNTLTPNLNSANSTLSTLSLEAEQAQKAMQALGTAAKTTADEIDQAISAMDNWDSHMGSTDATGLGAWALAAQMTGETTFAGSGSARNSQGQQVSALTELQAAEQAAGNALAATTTATNSSTASTISNTNATVDNTKATDDATTSTAGLTATIRGLDSAGSSSVTSITSTSDAINNDLLPAVNFAGMSGDQLGISIDSLSSQLLSAGVVVDGAGLSAVDYATKLQNTVDGMNSAAKASANLSSASSSAAQGIVNAAATISQVSQSLGISTGPSGTTTTSGFSSVPTTFTNGSGSGPASAALPGGFTATSVPGLGQGAGPGGQLASDFYANPYQNTVSFASTAGQSYQGGYTGLPGASGSAIQLTMNYPQFNSQQQSQKTMNDVVTMLRTVPSLKL